jgi:hypothetical protein
MSRSYKRTSIGKIKFSDAKKGANRRYRAIVNRGEIDDLPMRQKSGYKRYTEQYDIVDYVCRCPYSEVLKEIDEMAAEIKRNGGIVKHVPAFDQTIYRIHLDSTAHIKTEERIMHIPAHDYCLIPMPFDEWVKNKKREWIRFYRTNRQPKKSAISIIRSD